MSEQLTNREISTAPEIKNDGNQETIRINSEKTSNSEENKDLNVQEIRTLLLQQPPEPKELPLDDSSEGSNSLYIDRKIKNANLKKELKNIQKELPFSQKILSTAIHQRLVKKTSEISSKTITRPIGLLGGGLFAFIGSLAYLMLDKFIGLQYNYLVFIFLFLVGYVLFTIIEILSTPLRK